MADQATMVLKVRRKVNDWKSGVALDQTFEDIYYEDAIDFGMGRFNCDTNNSYTLLSLPSKYDWLIELLAAIEMCEAMVSVSNNTSSGAGAPLRTEVNGLEVWFQPAKEATAADLVKLCKELEAKYLAWLTRNGADIPDPDERPLMTSSVVLREDVGRGRANSRREVDRPLDAVSGLSVATVATGSKLTWTVVYETQFSKYVVQRILTGEDWDDDAVVVTSIYDNHISKFTDTSSLVAGTYEYRIVLYNRNNITSDSLTVSIVI